VNKKEKIALLSDLYNKIELSKSVSTGERHIIRKVLREEEWLLLSDDERQSRRKAAISLGKKWVADPFIYTGENHNRIADYTYEELVIAEYDFIREILKIIDTMNYSKNLDLLRIKMFLEMEKDFIDETFMSNKHMPPEFFKNLSNSFDFKYPDLNLSKFSEFYDRMYESWPNKP